jgi:hypothetical protein
MGTQGIDSETGEVLYRPSLNGHVLRHSVRPPYRRLHSRVRRENQYSPFARELHLGQPSLHLLADVFSVIRLFSGKLNPSSVAKLEPPRSPFFRKPASYNSPFKGKTGNLQLHIRSEPATYRSSFLNKMRP